MLFLYSVIFLWDIYFYFFAVNPEKKDAKMEIKPVFERKKRREEVRFNVSNPISSRGERKKEKKSALLRPAARGLCCNCSVSMVTGIPADPEVVKVLTDQSGAPRKFKVYV